jgi:Domain of unknown function (DUF4153)
MVGGWKRKRHARLLSLPSASGPRRNQAQSATSHLLIPGNKTMSIATTTDFEIEPARPLVTPLALAAICVALADWLFYGWPPGISLALFLAALGLVAVSTNRVHAAHETRIAMAIIFVAGLLAPAEDINFLSIIVGTLATAMFVFVTTSRQATSWQRQLFEAVTIPFRGPFQFAGDTIGALRHMKFWTPGWLGWLVAWIVPLTVFAVFLTLFSSANPLIEYRLMQIDMRKVFALIDGWRLSFWVFVICTIWPLIHRRIKPKLTRESSPPPPPPAGVTASSDLDYLLGAQAITRSLVLFNALFALQTALDLAYLWGGATLPDGLSHAEYAHRGAYPLIATALLAGGFVLLAMRPGGPAEESKLIRPLVLIWIAQNILLVISSIFRLDLYVAAYSLTYWRFAAFIWMVLVGTGLILILFQIVMRKPNSWLIAANAVSLALVIYGCCFINAPRLISFYNLEHSRENGGKGPVVDVGYLASLGPQAIPALEAYVEKMPRLAETTINDRRAEENQIRHRNWRAFGFRSWRLEQYLTNHPGTSSNPPPGNAG